jgi:branched-chain amino acid transport system permease protein
MSQQLINGAVLCSIYILFSLGLTLSWGALDVLNLAHGAMMMFGAFVAFVVTAHADLPLWLLFVVGIATAGIATLLLDVVVFRYIRAKVTDKRQAELLTLIAGVGAAAIPVTIAQAYTTDSPFGIGHLHWPVYHLGGSAQISVLQASIILVGIVLCVALAFWVARTRTGRALRAVAFDGETSELMGVNTRALSAMTMLIAGSLAGLAGMLLVVYLGSLTPESGEGFMLKGFAIVILGSVGSIWGTFIGAIVLAGAETLVVAQTSGTWVDAISFAIILIVILLRPQGLLGRGLVERV